MSSSEKIIQLRRLLSERFPGARFSASAAKSPNIWATGVSPIDTLLHGGLPKGGMVEIVNERNHSGSALFIATLLRKAAAENQIVTLIDGQDSFDPCAFGPEALSRLLWVRCKNASEAMKAVDLILRDRNLPLSCSISRSTPQSNCAGSPRPPGIDCNASPGSLQPFSWWQRPIRSLAARMFA